MNFRFEIKFVIYYSNVILRSMAIMIYQLVAIYSWVSCVLSFLYQFRWTALFHASADIEVTWFSFQWRRGGELYLFNRLRLWQSLSLSKKSEVQVYQCWNIKPTRVPKCLENWVLVKWVLFQEDRTCLGDAVSVRFDSSEENVCSKSCWLGSGATWCLLLFTSYSKNVLWLLLLWILVSLLLYPS